MTDESQTIWNEAVETLASMCVAEMLGRGPEKGAFILTLRIYADEMEKLIGEQGYVE